MIASFGSRDAARLFDRHPVRRFPPLLQRLMLRKLLLLDKWRECFRWQDGAAHDVEIVDYH